jgi:site-specific DNA recombinase
MMMEQSREKTAVIYCRVSTDEQIENTSFDSQEEVATKKAEELGYKVVKVIKEQHTGSELWERPQMNQLLKEIKSSSKPYDAVIVKKLDRLARTDDYQVIIGEMLKRYNVRLISATEEIDDSITGKLIRKMMGLFAEVEYSTIRARTLEGKKTKVSQGKLVNATDLYGYRTETITDGNGGKKKVRIIRENEALIVKRIFKEYVGDASIRSIYRNLNNDDVPSPASGKRNFKNLEHFTNLARTGRTLWNKGAVTRILKEPAYYGKTIAWRNKIEYGYDGGEKYHRIKQRDRSEWIELPDDITQPIIDVATFQIAQERLASNRGDNTRNEARPVLLRGLVVCALCGRKMNPDKEKGKLNVFRCPSRGLEACGGKRINADKCEAAVWEKVSEIIRKPEIIASELERRKENGAAERENLLQDVAMVKGIVKRIENEIRNLIVNVSDLKGYAAEVFQSEVKSKEKERERMINQVAEAENRLAAFDADLQGLTALNEYSKRVANNLDSFGFDEKRLAMEALNVRVVGNSRDFRVNISLPLMFEKKEELRTNHSANRSAGFGQNDARQTSADDFAAARI